MEKFPVTVRLFLDDKFFTFLQCHHVKEGVLGGYTKERKIELYSSTDEYMGTIFPDEPGITVSISSKGQ